MGSAARHFILGLILGALSIIMLYAMLNAVTIGDNGVNYTNAIIVIIAYGIVSVLVGEFLVKFSSKKK